MAAHRAMRLYSWSWTAPASFCSHFCLAPWSGAQLCSRTHHQCGGVMVAVYVGVQNLQKMVARNGVGIPGLSYISFKFIKGFLHPWPKQCLEAFNIRAIRALLITGRAGWSRRAKDWPWGTADNICGTVQFPLQRQLLSQGVWHKSCFRELTSAMNSHVCNGR